MKSVGKQLLEARQARNWTPERASRETKIRVDRLLDLEKDEYGHFTSPAYARGFVRTYARALGLDEYKILRQLDHKLPEEDHSTLVHESGVPYAPSAARGQHATDRQGSGLYVVMGLGLAVAGVLAFVLFQAYRSGELPRYFNNGETPVAATPAAVPAAATNAATADGPARALPVDPNHPLPAIPAETTNAPVAVETNGVPVSPKALPVDPSELSNTTTAAPPSTASAESAPPSVTAGSSAPAEEKKPESTAPRALPVDPAELAAASTAPPAPAPAPVVAAVTNAEPVHPAEVKPVNAPPPDAGPVVLNDAGLPVHQPPSTGPAKRLVLTASHDSFVRVTAEEGGDNERVLYASVLRGGQSISFDGHKFSVNVGVPSAVDISLDGVNYGPHSDQDSPETFTVESHQP